MSSEIVPAHQFQLSAGQSRSYRGTLIEVTSDGQLRIKGKQGVCVSFTGFGGVGCEYRCVAVYTDSTLRIFEGLMSGPRMLNCEALLKHLKLEGAMV